MFAIRVAQIHTWWEMSLEVHSHISAAVYITFLMELHPAFPIRTLFFMNKGHGIGITKKTRVAVEGTQLSPLVIKQTTWQDSNALKHQQGRNQRWKRSIRSMELSAGLRHLTGQLPHYLHRAPTNRTFSSILHNTISEAAPLLAAGLAWYLLPAS